MLRVLAYILCVHPPVVKYYSRGLVHLKLFCSFDTGRKNRVFRLEPLILIFLFAEKKPPSVCLSRSIWILGPWQ